MERSLVVTLKLQKNTNFCCIIRKKIFDNFMINLADRLRERTFTQFTVKVHN